LQLAALFPDVTVDQARQSVGWPLQVAAEIETLEPPGALELETLRALYARTQAAHSRAVQLPGA
jgi:glutaconate CoA-transferase subunit B